MTKAIARATNDRGEVVELRKLASRQFKLVVDGKPTAIPIVGYDIAHSRFVQACAVEKDHE